MNFLIINAGGYLYSCSELTQEILASARNDNIKVIRFHEGKFEFLSPHKWRNEGGWDEQSLWKERWIEINNVFCIPENYPERNKSHEQT